MKPRLQRIVSADWPALFCLMSVPGIWVIGFLFPLVRAGSQFGQFEMLAIALPISLLAAGCFLWRVRRVQLLFSRGVLVRGCITRISLARDRGRIEFTYEFDGREFQSWMPVHQSSDVLALRESQPVELLVDASSPRRAIIAHLFT